jgi:hypothetical protein
MDSQPGALHLISKCHPKGKGYISHAGRYFARFWRVYTLRLQALDVHISCKNSINVLAAEVWEGHMVDG